jgi:hypothetical protein
VEITSGRRAAEKRGTHLAGAAERHGRQWADAAENRCTHREGAAGRLHRQWMGVGTEGIVDDHRERRGTATSRGARLDVFVCPTRATPKGRKGTTTRFIRVKKDSMPHE